MTLPEKGWHWAAEGLAIIALLLCIGVPLMNWNTLPDTIPVHFGPNGQPDRWGPRSTVLLLPGIAVALYVGLSWIASRPQFVNMPVKLDRDHPAVKSLLRDMVLLLRTAILSTFALLSWHSVNVALGNTEALPIWFLPLTILMPVAILGFFLLRLQRLS